MRGVAAVALGLVLSACATTADPLPPSFDGVWDATTAACADQDRLTRLRIAGASLQYYEWGDEVLSAQPDGEGSIRIDLDSWSIDDTDANERPITRRRAGKLTLSPDRSRLIVAVDGDVRRYVRCSA